MIGERSTAVSRFIGREPLPDEAAGDECVIKYTVPGTPRMVNPREPMRGAKARTRSDLLESKTPLRLGRRRAAPPSSCLRRALAQTDQGVNAATQGAAGDHGLGSNQRMAGRDRQPAQKWKSAWSMLFDSRNFRPASEFIHQRV